MTDQDLIKEAREELEKLYNESKDRKDAFTEDMGFAHNVGDGQWDPNDVSDRDDAGRPHLTSNKLGKFVQSVVNQERGLPDRDKVIPVDDKGDPAIASIYNDLILDIEYRSEFDEITALAGEHAVSGGFGFWRILTRFTGDDFDQEVFIAPIKNPLLIELDPKGKRGFIREVTSTRDFKQEYPKAKERADFDEADDELWYEPDKIWKAEYFKQVPYKQTLVEVMMPGQEESSVFELTEENEEEISKYKLLRERTIPWYKVEWYKITGHEVLERGEWAGSEIPIIEVVGHEINSGGRTYKKSLIRDVKDMNRMYNYWLTSMTEKVALAPKAPFMVTEQQILGHEKMWEQANTANLPYLLYNPSSAGIPQRMPAPQVDVGELTMLNIANADIQDILSLYEASKGQTSNERSGKAIMARAARSDLATFHFPDNLRRAKVKTRKQLIEIIPKYYDTPRIVRLRNKAEKDAVIKLNYPEFDAKSGTEIKTNDLSKGRYDIRFNIQGHPSRRQQITEDFIQMLQYAPKEYHDIIFNQLLKFMDIEGAEEMSRAIAERSQQLMNMKQQELLMKGGNTGLPM